MLVKNRILGIRSNDYIQKQPPPPRTLGHSVNLRVPCEGHQGVDRTHIAQPNQAKLRVPREGHQVNDKDGI